MVEWLKELKNGVENEVREQGDMIMLRNNQDEKRLDSLVDFTVIFLLSQDRILGVWVGEAMRGRGLISNVVQERGGFIIW